MNQYLMKLQAYKSATFWGHPVYDALVP